MMTLGIVLGLCAAAIVRLRFFGKARRADLGWMSEQWLTEHRATHLA